MCNHINKQFVNIEGQYEDLKCALPEGHDGDHSAKYKALRAIEGIKDPRKETVIRDGREYYVVEEDAFWGDAAGRTTFEIAEEMEEKRAQLEAFKQINPGASEAHRAKARELGLVPALRA